MVGKPGGRVSAWKRTLERDVRPRHRHRHTRFARLPGRNWQGFFCAKGRWASGVRNHKPCRLWDGGSVSSWMKSLAAWLAPTVPNFPAWYGYSRADSV